MTAVTPAQPPAAKRVLVVEDELMIRMHLDGEPVLPVADALVARGMPFVFATGYGERGVPGAYRDRPMLKKPFQMEGLKQMLQSALEGEKN
ncbi:MAG: hypothetical protein E6G86_19825 [Alphaproteobacteria bacterium]|nr:MAG: hypothetical protein E6G86_19825 [Alphaproteobacteria bacterium]